MSIITLKKPVPTVAESDWYNKIYELQQFCDNYRIDAVKLQNESHSLRNETDITTHWNTHRANSQIIDRRTEITRWENVFKMYYKQIQNEIENMKNDKKNTEKVLEFLNLNFTVVNHCMTLREERGGADLCHDSVSVGLEKEKDSLERLKTLLAELCQIAWDQINRLEELRINTGIDLDDKNNSIIIDTKLLEMTKNSENITLKPDPFRKQKDFSTYEKWLQRCNNMKLRIENELSHTRKLREYIYVPRDNIKNDLRALNDNINYALRSRIFDTEKIKNELEWQKMNMIADKETFLKEIEHLDNALDSKLNFKKLVETRYEERQYRTGIEKCIDKPTIELCSEHFELDETINMLTNKLVQTKEMHNDIVEAIKLINEELKNKTHALSVDQKCIEYRMQLKERN